MIIRVNKHLTFFGAMSILAADAALILLPLAVAFAPLQLFLFYGRAAMVVAASIATIAIWRKYEPLRQACLTILKSPWRLCRIIRHKLRLLEARKTMTRLSANRRENILGSWRTKVFYCYKMGS